MPCRRIMHNIAGGHAAPIGPPGVNARRHAARGRAVTAAALLAALSIAYAGFPRDPDLRRFDPEAIGRIEATLWRDYYDKRYVALIEGLYDLAREQYGFSPWDSVRLAVAAARAARLFQSSRTPAEAEAALPWLAKYFRVLAHGAPGQIDARAAARAELAWWQARREGDPPERYGLLVARVSTLVYGIDGALVRDAGARRAGAMAYRDARDNAMTEADWSAIAAELAGAYRSLKRAIAEQSRS